MSKGCAYCLKERSVIGGGDEIARVYIEGKRLVLEGPLIWGVAIYREEITTVKIGYCPMCGRDIREEL